MLATNNENEEIAPSILPLLAIGLASLLTALIITVLFGFYAGIKAAADTTLYITYVMVVFTSPFIGFAALGGALYHIYRWKWIAISFNVMGVLLLIACIVLNFIWVPEETSLAENSVENGFTVFLELVAIATVFFFILFVESQLAWPTKKHTK